MKIKILFASALLTASLIIVSCGGKDKNKNESKSETVGPAKVADDGMVPKIDTATLKDEASILDAMQKVVDASIADEKKQKEDSLYSGHYVELSNLHAVVLNASTAYSKTISDPAKAVEFSNKVSAIQDKMYPK